MTGRQRRAAAALAQPRPGSQFVALPAPRSPLPHPRLVTAAPTTLADALADRYRLEHEIGQGGMATVYLAEDVRHRRKVAVKVLRPELSAALGPDRFLREIHVAAGLSH